MNRYLSRRGDFYGDDNCKALWCDMIARAAADFAETVIQAAFQPSAEIAMASLQARLAKFGPVSKHTWRLTAEVIAWARALVLPMSFWPKH